MHILCVHGVSLCIALGEECVHMHAWCEPLYRTLAASAISNHDSSGTGKRRREASRTSRPRSAVTSGTSYSPS